MKTTVPLLVPKTDEITRKIQLPSTKFFPDGVEDRTFLIIDEPDGSKEKLWLWTELANKKLFLQYHLARYTTDLQDNHSITVKKSCIVDMTVVDTDTGFTNDRYHNWSSSELSQVAHLVTAGIITTVEYLWLSDHKYSLADLQNL